LISKENISNKKKIFNDPVYGFISIPGDFIFDLIEHPYFQRLRRIKQLGLTHLVYPGALHTRFHHVLGAMHLMGMAIEVIRRKGTPVSEDEEQAVVLAILLHDIGHGPFSHALEHSIVKGVSHEDISSLFMEKLNKEFDGKLTLAIEVFEGEYHRPFLHQLVSSQLDMDRLDYLNRDRFYTGVSEGMVGSDRIISMLVVKDDQLLLEEKGIYSIEKFIVARRLMYWQVYLHKTVVGAEFLLVNILKRAEELIEKGVDLFATPALKYFLTNHVTLNDFQNDPKTLDLFAQLDDYDVMTSVKVWMESDDRILSMLCERLVNRKLFKVKITKERVSESDIQLEKRRIMEELNITLEEASYFIVNERLVNSAYNKKMESINLLYKNQEVVDLPSASDNFNISALSNPVEKYCFCYPV
jgi:HD superfamily phosphohydrolase